MRFVVIGLVVLLPAASVVAARAVGVRSVRIVSNSMAPTVDTGEWVMVADVNGGRWSPRVRRGDVVLFEHPPASGDQALKRVIAISGDTVEAATDTISINGRARPLAAEANGTRPVPTRVEYVPPGHVYLLGDNSAQSVDSRVFGPVRNDRLVAKHVVTLGTTRAILVKGAVLVALVTAALVALGRIRTRRDAGRKRQAVVE